MKAKIEMADLIGLSAQLNPTYILSTDYATFRTGDVAEKQNVCMVVVIAPSQLFRSFLTAHTSTIQVITSVAST